MNLLSLSWVLSGLFFFLFVVAHLFGAKYFFKKSQSLLMVYLFPIFSVALLLVLWSVFHTEEVTGEILSRTPSQNLLTLHTMVVFLFFFGFSLWFYAALDHAVRIRVLVELYYHPDMLLGDLIRKYSPEDAIFHRLEQLSASGYLELKNGRAQLLSKGQKFAEFVVRVRNWLGC